MLGFGNYQQANYIPFDQWQSNYFFYINNKEI